MPYNDERMIITRKEKRERGKWEKRELSQGPEK